MRTRISFGSEKALDQSKRRAGRARTRFPVDAPQSRLLVSRNASLGVHAFCVSRPLRPANANSIGNSLARHEDDGTARCKYTQFPIIVCKAHGRAARAKRTKRTGRADGVGPARKFPKESGPYNKLSRKGLSLQENLWKLATPQPIAKILNAPNPPILNQK